MTRKEFIRYLVWEWIEPIGAALLIALTVMHFVARLYVIESGSMQPTLHGRADYPSEGGDKVFINKFMYRFREPERWEIFIFDFPYPIAACDQCGAQENAKEWADTATPLLGKTCPVCGQGELELIKKDYIKRCVGLPGEKLKIVDGNLLKFEKDEWVRLPRSREVEDAMWKEAFNAKRNDLSGHFNILGASRFKVAPNGIVFTGGEKAELRFNREDLLRTEMDGGEEGDKYAPFFVGDIRIRTEVGNHPAAGMMTLSLVWNDRIFRGLVDYSKKKALVMEGSEILAEFTLPENFSAVHFSKIDGKLKFDFDDTRFETPVPDLRPDREETRLVKPMVAFSGEAQVLKDLCIDQDVYYFPTQGANPLEPGIYTVADDGYYAMGDNSGNSSDSRSWGSVPRSSVQGIGVAIVYPFSRMRILH